MISDRALVLAAAATYEPKAAPLIEAIGGVLRVFRTEVDGLTVIAIEGTHNRLGWLLDFIATKTEDHQAINHPTLGFLHAGFHLEAATIAPEIALMVHGRDYALAGHSLGAALALLLGGLLIDDGHAPVKIGAFAPPRVGGPQFIKTVASVPIAAVRFGDDPVPGVPFEFDPDFPYRQVPLAQVGAPMINPFSCHHIDNYVNAIGGAP
jgi:Lipase (class 3)